MVDSRTTLIVAAGLYLLLPLLVWLVVRGQRDRSVIWWCLGSLMAGSGIVLIGLREHLPVLLSFHLANSALLGSFVLWAQSLRMALGRPWPVDRVGALLALPSLVYALLYAFASPADRGLGVRLMLGVLAVLTALLAWRLAGQTRSKNAQAIAGSYAVLAAALWLQVVLSGWAERNPDPFSAAWDAGLLALMALLTAVVGHFSYAGMVLDGAARQRLQAMQAQVEDEAARLLDLRLIQQERERRLSLVSASLAHELNQPLTVVDAHLQMAERLLTRPEPSPELMTQLIEKLLLSAERAAAILNRIRASSQQKEPVWQPVNLHEQVLLASEQLEPLAQELGVEVQIQAPQGSPWCSGDPLALSQVLVNLMRNAMQAMQSRSSRVLGVFIEADAGHVQMRVQDTGPGLSAQMLQVWGQPFRTTRTHGLGMGLAISRDIVEQHHGSLTLGNRPEGGAQATMRLPLHEESRHGA